MADQDGYEEMMQRYREMADQEGAMGTFFNGVADGMGAARTAAAPKDDAGYQATLEEYREQGEEWGERVGGALGGTLGGLVTLPAAGIGAAPGKIAGEELGKPAGAELGVDVGRVVESGDPGEIGASFGGIVGHVTGMGHDETADVGRDLGNDPYVIAEFEEVVETAATWANDPGSMHENAAEAAVDYASDYVADSAEAAYDEVTSWFD